MSVIADGRGGYIDSATGQRVDARGQPVAAGTGPGGRTIAQTGQTTQLGTPTNPYGGSVENPNYQLPTNFVNDPNLTKGYQQYLNYYHGINDPSKAFAAMGADANGNPVAGGPNNGLSGRTIGGGTQVVADPFSAYNTAPGTAPAGGYGAGISNMQRILQGITEGAGGGSQNPDVLNAWKQLGSVGGAQNTIMSGYDPYREAATAIAGGYGNAQQIADAYKIPLADVQQMTQLMPSVTAQSQAAATPQNSDPNSLLNLTGANQMTGTGGVQPANTAPVDPNANAMQGTINPTAGQQMRANYMDSPGWFNPYGTNTYGVQNQSDSDLFQAGQNTTGANPYAGVNAASQSFSAPAPTTPTAPGAQTPTPTPSTNPSPPPTAPVVDDGSNGGTAFNAPTTQTASSSNTPNPYTGPGSDNNQYNFLQGR